MDDDGPAQRGMRVSRRTPTEGVVVMSAAREVVGVVAEREIDLTFEGEMA